MWIQRLQKIISGFLIFFLLFSITLNVPFQQYFSTPTYAADKEFFNLVSIIVDEDTYDEVKSKLVRYSRDIQGVMENTRVVILPTPSDASVLDIASLNESLYLEGYKSVKDNVDFESRLVGTVLVGKIPVPVVFDDSNSGRSILPYVDFIDKSYIFDHEFQRYMKSDVADSSLNPEVWHGVISPNTGDFDDDIDAIQDYFDKNHDFYVGEGVFEQEKGIIDGKNTVALSDYEPYVFYYDQFRENSALQYQKYVGYQMYLQNIEDITYNRYSKDLAEKVKDQVLGTQNVEIGDLLKKVDPSFDISGLSSGPDTQASSDVLTRYITDNSTKKFLEIFNGSALGEMRKYVYNAGRYNEGGTQVNVDMPPFLISVLDEVSSEVIKNVNTSLEKEITEVVKNGLSRNIAISEYRNIKKSCNQVFRTFYNGMIANSIENASQCTIYRGNTSSGTLVEANRGYNVTLVGDDVALCGAQMRTDSSGKVTQGLSGYWGGNTPVNLSNTGSIYSDLNLGNHDITESIRPIYDILGSKETDDATKNPTPIDCFTRGVNILTYKERLESSGVGENGGSYSCELDFQAPVLGKSAAGSWTCNQDNSPQPLLNFEEVYKAGGVSSSNISGLCVNQEYRLTGSGSITWNVDTQYTRRGSEGESCTAPLEVYSFKTISSYILHTSPTATEFGAQVNSMFTPSLPIDSDRYIDFIGAKGGNEPDYGYQRIDFPQMFRVKIENKEDLNFETISQKVKEHLDQVSANMNTVIRNADPESLSGKDEEIYQLLNTGAYPDANIDLYQILQDKPLEIFTSQNQSKEISYFDTLVFAVYWNNLNTVSSKYKFIFEEYLSNQFEGNEYDFHLPKSKKVYETSYLAAPGDAQNMFIKLDPEQKGVHPYADIISANLGLQTTLLGANVSEPESTEDTFKCSPPDGVPIWEWIPAVICWLSDMLPPKIKISGGSCGYDTLFLDEDEREELLACEGDVNKNGVNDCLEGKLAGGSLNMQSDAEKYFYNTSGVITTEILDSAGELVSFDNISYVNHDLSRVEVPNNPELPFDENNIKVVYDISIPDFATAEKREEAEKYVHFSSSQQRASRGSTKSYFYSKASDANVFFQASLQAIDVDGNTAINLVSNRERIEIRSDQVFVNSFKLENDGVLTSDNTAYVSGDMNLFLIDAAKNNPEDVVAQIVGSSQAKEKLLLSIQNYSQAGTILPLNYPISVQLLRDNQVIYEEINISSPQLDGIYPLYIAKESGQYELRIIDSSGFQTYRKLDLIPERAENLETSLSTNIMEVGGNISTHLVTIADAFGNPATGEIYSIEMLLEGGGLVFDTNNDDTISYQILEGYKAFRLKSTNREAVNTLNITLTDVSGNVIDSSIHTIRTIDDIQILVEALDGTPQVGNKEYRYKVSFSDASGNILTDLQSRVYLSLGKLFGTIPKAYSDVVGGVAEVSFTTKTLAAENVVLELQLEGGNNIYKHAIDILPEEAIKIDLGLSQDKIEASEDGISILQASLKDRYNNTVFNDNTTILSTEIHDESLGIIRLDSNQKTVIRGKTQFQITGTDIPGTAYFKVSSNPDLGENTFDLVGQSPFLKERLTIPTFLKADGTLTNVGKLFFKEFSDTKYFISRFSTQTKLESSEAYLSLNSLLQNQVSDLWDETNYLTLSGIGENAGSIETFYFWDKKDITGNAYNGMYSVLLGAPYGDISQENYLAGALLFDRNNSSLAVSSLLNTPYSFQDVFSIQKNGSLGSLQSSDITQDLEFSFDFDDTGRLFVDIENAALSTYVGRIYYNITDTSDISLKMTGVTGYNAIINGEDVVLKNASGKTIFEAYESGRFFRKSGTFVTLDYNYVGEGIQLLIQNGEDVVASMNISGNFDINVTRDENLLQTKLATLDDTLIVHLFSGQYSSREIVSDENSAALHFYYQDPFADAYNLDDFHNNDGVGLESSYDEAGIGWQESNTMLLNFSAGSSVGESTKEFQSFSLINLGDPVFSLKALDVKFNDVEGQTKSFDATVGELISDNEGLIGYQTFDYNNDDAVDIITIHQSGYLELFENTPVDGTFLAQRNLAIASDGGSVRLVKTGDFTADGYDDIFFVTDAGEPALFNNVEKDFRRVDLGENFSLSGSIIQAESYDMDADGKDDIITLDDTGSIHIFYGNGTSENPSFTQKFIGDGYGVSLSETSINHGGAIYFDGMTQISEDKAEVLLRDSQEYLTSLSGALSTGGEAPDPEFIDEALVDSFLYISLPYIPTSYESNSTQQENFITAFSDDIESIGGSDEASSMSSVSEELNEFTTEYNNYITYSGYENSYSSSVYFLRSQYADTQGLQIEKTFEDTSPPYLQTGDRVYYDISIKNTSSRTIRNVAYVDTIPEFFTFKNDEFTVLTQENLVIERKAGVGDYDILLDGLTLAPGEETKVRIELETLPLSYGHIQVGLYEAGEVGDDIYGDIIIKDDEKNCGAEADIFRSTAERSYLEGVTHPTCDADSLDIGNTFPELIDDDNDGIPDYLQTLLDENVVDQTLIDYAEEAISKLALDTDNDSLPDSVDSMNNTDSATDFMGALDSINEAIDDISADVDELIQGLSCGFGGGSCFANPLNWAPLAPGSVPTLMGMPLGALTPSTGVPIFSALTGSPIYTTHGCFEVPTAYPISTDTFDGRCGGPPSAGGTLGVLAPTNFVRLFATPTLTGGFGIAACFGGPAIVAGNANPMGVHPIVPGGNCIVAAMPLFGCEGGEGDPGALGYPYLGDGFDIIAGNCDGELGQLSTPQQLEQSFVQDYLEYLRTGVKPVGMYQKYEEVFTQMSENGSGNYYLPSEPLINIGNGDIGMMSTTVDIDTSALASGNFQDVRQVKNKRVGAFPNFLMDWVERQLDEVTSKLTNLPNIMVILPDFGGVMDFSWKDFGTEMNNSAEDQKTENTQKRTQSASNITQLQAQKTALDCSGSDRIRCATIDLSIASASGKSSLGGVNETLSGIKEAYEFIGNIPLVNIETETINVSVPWIDQTELNRFLVDWKYSAKQWESEIESAKNAWSIGAACDQETQAERDRCEQENDIKEKAYVDAKDFLYSLQTNIQILEEYKEFPDRLAKLMNIKEVWLEQILCNIEAISTLLGEWIGTNGKRFKAWVELYVLIKAILKSWQLLIDVFTGYEEECHECKNERQDLQNFIFRLISAIIPSPPIIEFPKWPDIILDMHNIRAGMTIYMPDFQVSVRPIVLPTLPRLNLPAVPSAGFTLPELPILPRYTLPELPDLPSLPTIELPDLPPPPTIPKLFGAVEGILNIMKLVTKVMCILKNSPFVPEWRAGDQIAFLTERNGYLPTDFIDIQPPAFSYSAISAIKVTTYVNFEFEMEFIIEAVRSITAPLDDISSNIVNMFDMQMSNIDLSEAVPEDININIEQNGEINPEISLAPLSENPEGIYVVAAILAKKAQDLLSYMLEHSSETLSNEEFKQYVGSQLASNSITSEPRTQELQDLWKQVFDLQYSKEDTFIKELQDNSAEKFQTIGDILSTEIEYSKQQQKELENLGAPTFITQTTIDTSGSKRISAYNTMLETYNMKSLDAAIQLVSGESTETRLQRQEIKAQGEDIMNDLRGGLTAYKENALLAAETSSSAASGGTCNTSGTYQYTYDGIYVLEYGKNYKLFTYTDMLRGDETPSIIDIDGDKDDDVLYLADGRLYFKENRTNTPEKSYITTGPLILSSNDNKFFNGNIYYEAVNYFQEARLSDAAINVEFQKPTDSSLKNFRMIYNTIVDRYMDDQESYIPSSVETHIVDAISNISEQATSSEGSNYSIKKNLATLKFSGNISGAKLTTSKLENIKTKLSENTVVTLTSKTPLYAGNNSFRIKYIFGNGEQGEISVPKNQSITFETPATIIGLTGDAYVSLGIQEDIYGTNIGDFIGKPLLVGSKITFEGNPSVLDHSSHIDVEYYDSSLLQIDLREVQSYTLYDLGSNTGKEHSIRLGVPNDFYYARITAFKNDFIGIWSQQILLAPQTYSDTLAPQIGLNQKIRIPVYQTQNVDITSYIYEDGGISGISDVQIDFDLSVDNDNDGNSRNDIDTDKITIEKTASRINIIFGPYESLFEKKIQISIIDDNGNKGTKEVSFEVYAPDPEIETINDNLISGTLDESLLNEPVRLYRYRGGVIQKLQTADGTDLVETDTSGLYNFEATETSTGLTLTYSGTTIANIDEYSGKIDILSALTSTKVLPSNNVQNESIYPEIQILYGVNPIFRQFVKIPEGEINIVANLSSMENTGIYVNILDQDRYASYRIPLGVTFNPGSVSIYQTADEDKKAVMTLFRDGRIHINESLYRLEYRSIGENASLVLVQKGTNIDIAQIVFHMQASYIIH